MRAVVTGAAGFVGYHLTKQLSEAGYKIYAIVRPNSPNNKRIKDIENVICIEADIETPELRLADYIKEKCDYFYHLAWKPADRFDYFGQMENAYITCKMLEQASEIGCGRFIGIGSQAEYGKTTSEILEDITPPQPYCGYGSAKVAACYWTRRRASELKMEWVWGRIFSIYGKYEPVNRLIPQVIKSLNSGEVMKLTSCRQNWDFLNGSDAGKALIALGERGHSGEIYNIADGRYRSLKDFLLEIEDLYNDSDKLIFGEDANPFVSLQPSVMKLNAHTGWSPNVDFIKGISSIRREY